MKSLLVIIEKKDGKYFNLKKVIIDSGLAKEKCGIYIVYYGSTDASYIESQCKNISIVEKIDIDKIPLSEEHQNALDSEAKKIVDSYFISLSNDFQLENALKVIYGSLFEMVKKSLILREKISNILNRVKPVRCFLFGKQHSAPFVEGDINFLNAINYSETLSAWGRLLVNEREIPFIIYRTDNWITKRVVQSAKYVSLMLGVIGKSKSFHLIVNKEQPQKTKNSTLILLRGPVHIKLAARLLSENNKDVIFIIDSKRITKKSLEQGFSNYSEMMRYERLKPLSLKEVFNVLSIHIDIIKNISFYKENVRNLGFDGYLPIVSMIVFTPLQMKIRENLHQYNINTFITFEETNLFGALFSRSLVSTVDNSVCVQHGFTVSFSRTMPLICNERWVWGPYFKEQYMLRGENEEKLIDKGMYLLSYHKYEGLREFQKLSILLAPAYNIDPNNLSSWISKALISLRRLDVKEVIITLHPNQPLTKNQLEKIMQGEDLLIKIISGCSEQDILNSDIIICGNTTVGFEAALLGKPVFYFLKKQDQIIYSYVLQPYIEKLLDGEDLLVRLNEMNWEIKHQQHSMFLHEYGIEDSRKVKSL